MIQRLPLGRLRPVELRKSWESESGDFTPWLAQAENIRLLGEALGMELEVHAQEHRVGAFRADIVCTDLSDQTKVLIENQLQSTDHGHLGQLLTYAAGLAAVSIVWIAKEFCEEHRAALDWLNRMTHESVSFFGLEIELWAIGESPPAPKFNVVVKPNDWSNRVAAAGELSERDQLYTEYWAAFGKHLEQSRSPLPRKRAKPQMWMTLPIGRSAFSLVATVSKQHCRATAALVLYGPNRATPFKYLLAERAAIESALGFGLEWRPMEDKTETKIIRTLEDADPADRAGWDEQHRWLRETLEALQRVFAARVRQLSVDEDTEQDSG